MPSGRARAEEATGETKEKTRWKMLERSLDGWMLGAIKCRPYDTWEWKADCHVAKCLPPLTDTESASGPIT